MTLSPERQSARTSKITNEVPLNPVSHRMLYDNSGMERYKAGEEARKM